MAAQPWHHSCDLLACCVYGISFLRFVGMLYLWHHSCNSLACCVYGNIILAICWHAVSMAYHSCDSLACCVYGILAIRWHAVTMASSLRFVGMLCLWQYHSCTSLACCVYGNIILAIRWHAVSMQMEKWERDEHVVALPSSFLRFVGMLCPWHHPCDSLACCVYGNIILALRWHAVSMAISFLQFDGMLCQC